MRGAIGNMDVAQIILYAFWFFFAGLIFYLRREDRREGYPLENEVQRGSRPRDFLWIPTPKTFLRADGRKVQAPNFRPTRGRSTRRRPSRGRARRSFRPAIRCPPTSGRAATPNAPDEPYQTAEGHDLLAPLRVATNFAVPAEGANPIGFEVFGADRPLAGVDQRPLGRPRRIDPALLRSRACTGGKRVLVPVHFADVDSAPPRHRQGADGRPVRRRAGDARPDKVTLLEEDKISAYYGAARSTPRRHRTEPLL